MIGEEPVIEHAGSTAVGIGGKNIVDILIGAKNQSQIEKIRDVLLKNGYYSGMNHHPNRIFLASRKEETGEGDFHIHICPVNENEYQQMILLRDYLRANPDKAQEYFEKKKEIAKTASYDRKTYKKIKNEYVAELIAAAKDWRDKKRGA